MPPMDPMVMDHRLLEQLTIDWQLIMENKVNQIVVGKKNLINLWQLTIGLLFPLIIKWYWVKLSYKGHDW